MSQIQSHETVWNSMKRLILNFALCKLIFLYTFWLSFEKEGENKKLFIWQPDSYHSGLFSTFLLSILTVFTKFFYISFVAFFVIQRFVCKLDNQAMPCANLRNSKCSITTCYLFPPSRCMSECRISPALFSTLVTIDPTRGREPWK